MCPTATDRSGCSRAASVDSELGDSTMRRLCFPVGTLTHAALSVISGVFILAGLSSIVGVRQTRVRRSRANARLTDRSRLDEDPDSFTVGLIQNRAQLDPRLKDEDVTRWPMCRFWPTPD